MKRAIRILLCVLAASLFAMSCSKTTLNSIAISGKWTLLKTVTTENGAEVETWYPATSGMTVDFLFESGGYHLKTETSVTGITHSEGSWLVDNNELIVTYSKGSYRYYIEKAGLLELILRETYTEHGHTYVDILTLKHLSE